MRAVRILLMLCLGGAGATLRAESDINSGPGANLPAIAHLNFRVGVPRVIYLRIGTGTYFADVGTRNRVTFTTTAANVLAGAPITGTPSAGPIVARVVSNGGDVSFRASGTNGGLASGANRIPWTRILPSASGGSLAHPAIGNGAPGAVTSLVAAGGLVDQSATYTFSYTNATPVPPGTYNGRVTYTASLP
jgi:hypothetical protein